MSLSGLVKPFWRMSGYMGRWPVIADGGDGRGVEGGRDARRRAKVSLNADASQFAELQPEQTHGRPQLNQCPPPASVKP
jgi:hypothetical protein